MNQDYTDIHKEVVELSKAGNRKAQYQLYQLYSKAMLNICFRMMNSREEAEDMLQEAFAEAFKRLESFRYESSFGAWLKRIVINRCINALKKRKADLVNVEDIQHYGHEVEEHEDFDDSKLNVRRIQQAMGQLSEGYRVVFSLYLIEGYDHGEISEILGISESTSKSQFSRAKQKIKEILSNPEMETA